MLVRVPLTVTSLIAALALCAGLAAAADDPQHQPSPSPAAAASPAPQPSAPAPSLAWRSIGPAVSGGRIATVAGTNLDPALFYAGAAGGGLWKSVNGGADWRPVFDKAGTQSIGAIAISPKNASDVWVGTGEPWPRNDVIPGDGIYHSTDGGKTWNNAGLTQTSQIARVLIDPRDPRRIIVAALGDPFRDNPERGVFRTTDGGKTWEKTLYAGPAVGASDLVMDPENPDVLYAGLWRFRRSSWHLDSGGADDGIYKSSDGGATWSHLSGNGLPAGTAGRIALAIAPSDRKRIYALIESPEGILWRSDDGGASWTNVSSNTLINERPFYYSRIVVDPHDADHLFSVSVKLAESRTGGKTWHASGSKLHGDHHDLWFSSDGRTIIEANDGGVAFSRDNGATWTWHNTLPVSQFYHVAFDLETPYHVCGGLQDNGAWCAPVRTGDDRGILPQDWLKVGGGDGTFVLPDPRDPRIVYSAAGGGDNAGELFRVDTRAKTQTDISPYLRNQNVVPPSELAYRFNWETPLAFSPLRPQVLYAGGNVLFRSEDRGMHWSAMSPDLTRNIKARQTLTGGVRLDVTGAETFDTLLSVAPSPLRAGTIWVSSDDGVVQLTRDEGRHWRNVSIPGVDADSRIPAIEASHASAGRAYAAVDRHFVGDRTPYVYATDDEGKTWRLIVRGLPHGEVHVVREDPANANVLYAGTGTGVWWSEDRGASWKAFPATLPAVEVLDLAVQPRSGDLIAATHGRGMYVLDDLTPLREHAAAVTDGVRLFTLRDALPVQRFTPTVNAHGSGADVAPASLTFWQREPAKTAPWIEIVDAHGSVVRRFAGTHDEDGTDVPNVPNAAGVNRVAWSLDSNPPTPWRRAAKWDQGPDTGIPVLSGVYRVRLHRDGTVYERPLRVLRDRALRSADDEQRGYALAKSLSDELSALDDALNALDNVRLQVADRSASITDAALAERARAVATEAKRLEGTISSQPVNDQDNDFLRDLLRERVYSLLGNVASGTPSQAMVTEASVLQREGATALATYGTFVAKQIVPLNAALKAAGTTAFDLQAKPPKTKPDPNADEHASRRSESE
jgi:photosystem II stability/assembly factor-like uncharacterized protein